MLTPAFEHVELNNGVLHPLRIQSFWERFEGCQELYDATGVRGSWYPEVVAFV